MTKPENELITDLTLSRAGRIAKYKRAEKMANAPKVQRLSDIEPDDPRVLPANYRNYYEKLKLKDAQAAQEFWNTWAYDPRPKPRDPFELEKRVLSRVGRSNELKRRV